MTLAGSGIGSLEVFVHVHCPLLPGARAVEDRVDRVLQLERFALTFTGDRPGRIAALAAAGKTSPSRSSRDGDVTVPYTGPALIAGQFYQFRVTSFRRGDVPIS